MRQAYLQCEAGGQQREGMRLMHPFQIQGRSLRIKDALQRKALPRRGDACLHLFAVKSLNELPLGPRRFFSLWPTDAKGRHTLLLLVI